LKGNHKPVRGKSITLAPSRREPSPVACDRSWWVACAAPDQREAFMAAAHDRDDEREHAANYREARSMHTLHLRERAKHGLTVVPRAS